MYKESCKHAKQFTSFLVSFDLCTDWNIRASRFIHIHTTNLQIKCFNSKNNTAKIKKFGITDFND